jgi:DNA-binding CsgD family transcriptional regulator
MAALRERDLRAVLDLVHEAHEVAHEEILVEHLLGGLARLVPSDCVAFTEEDKPGVEGVYLTWPSEAALAQATLDDDELHLRTVDQNPLCTSPGDRRVHLLSDFLTRRELRHLELYDALRPYGEYFLKLPIRPGPATRAFMFDRCSRDFRERDKQVLELLRPHLIQVFRRRDAAETRKDAASALTPREREVLALVARGHTNAEIAQALFLSQLTVRRHLENIFEKLEVRTRTAAVARAFGTGVPQ